MKVFVKLIPLLITVILIVVFHELATVERGYHAVGGEVLFSGIAPLWYAYVHDRRRYKEPQNQEEEELTKNEFESGQPS